MPNKGIQKSFHFRSIRFTPEKKKKKKKEHLEKTWENTPKTRNPKKQGNQTKQGTRQKSKGNPTKNKGNPDVDFVRSELLGGDLKGADPQGAAFDHRALLAPGHHEAVSVMAARRVHEAESAYKAPGAWYAEPCKKTRTPQELLEECQSQALFFPMRTLEWGMRPKHIQITTHLFWGALL